MSIQTRNPRILRDYVPFLVATPNHVRLLDCAPFGLQIAEENIIDPTRMASERFLLLLQTMDRLTFGPEGMPMPRWVFYDCAELPGAIFGFARRAEELPANVLEAMGRPHDDTGLVPFSMFIAIPVRPPEVWFGHNLASLNATFPGLQLKGLASMTKALGIKVFRCKQQIGATQWDSNALHIHTRFGPLNLVTAWTPAHLEEATLTYSFDVTDEKIRNAYGDPDVELKRPEPDLEVAASDHRTMQALQTLIEAGARFAITGPPRRHEGEFRTPVAGVVRP